MYGQVYSKIQYLMHEGGKGNPIKASFIKTKLILKGIDPDKWGPNSNDSPEVIEVLDNLTKTLLGR